MPDTSRTIKDLTFDKEEFLNATDKAIQQIFREAALVFAETAAIKVPVVTGMARGSYLANVVRFTGAIGRSSTYLNYTGDFGINAARKSGRYGLFHKLPRLSDGEIKNKYAGARRSFYIFSGGKKLGYYSFEFKSGVEHYTLHETKWQSLAAGRRAFDAYVKKNLKKRVPQLKDYVKVR